MSLRDLKDLASERGYVLVPAHWRIAAAYGLNRYPPLYLLFQRVERQEWMWRACDLHEAPVVVGTRAQIEVWFDQAEGR